MLDHYLTIKGNSSALIKEKSSKFYAYAFPVDTITQVEIQLSQLRKEHLKSRHVCYAYFLNADRQTFRANDDGEPSGTAGRPIMGQIEKLGLTNTLVAVVRYFGGTKLGTSGLIKAYKEAAAEALEKNEIIEKLITSIVNISCSFEAFGNMMNIVSGLSLDILDVDYASNAVIKVEIRGSEVDSTIVKVKAKLLNRGIEDILQDTSIDGVSFDVQE